MAEDKEDNNFPTDLGKATRSVSSYRTWFRREAVSLEEAIANCEENKTSSFYNQELERLYKQLQNRFLHLKQFYLYIVAIDEESKAKKWTDDSESLNTTFSGLNKDCLRLLAEYEQTRAEERSGTNEAVTEGHSRGEPSTYVPQIRVQSLLKPEPLSFDFSPHSFRLWKDSYKQFFKSSKLGIGTRSEQRGFLLQTLAEDVKNCVYAKLTDSMDLEQCLAQLDVEFTKRYPEVTRRQEYFLHQQARGQKWSSFFHKEEQLALEADIENITEDQLRVQFLISQTIDKQLRTKLLKLNQPTRLALLEEALIFENEKLISKNLDRNQSEDNKTRKTDEVVNKEKPWSKKVQKSKSKENTRFTSRPKFKGKCDGCGIVGHKKVHCRAQKSSPRGKATCYNCKQEGHFMAECRNKKPMDRARSPSRGRPRTRWSTKSRMGRSHTPSWSRSPGRDGGRRYGKSYSRRNSPSPRRFSQSRSRSGSPSSHITRRVYVDESLVDEGNGPRDSPSEINLRKRSAPSLMTYVSAMGIECMNRLADTIEGYCTDLVDTIGGWTELEKCPTVKAAAHRITQISTDQETGILAGGSKMAILEKNVGRSWEQTEDPTQWEQQSCRSTTLLPGSSKKTHTPKINADLFQDGIRGGINIDVVCDTGSSKSIINKDMLRRGGFSYKRGNQSLRNADGQNMKVSGTVALKIKVRHGEMCDIHCLVSNSVEDDMLLCWADLIKCKLLDITFPRVIKEDGAKVNQKRDGLKRSGRSKCNKTTLKHVEDGPVIARMKAKYKDVITNKLSEKDKMRGPPMNVKFNCKRSDVKPYKCVNVRNTPLAYQAEADKMIQDLLDNGVIVRETEPNDWCAPAHFLRKPDSEPGNLRLRLVTDYTRLNKQVKRPEHIFPTIEQVRQEIKPNARWFCSLDMLHGYFQVPLSESASSLTCFMLKTGRYKYRRAPMGLCNSSDEFCYRSDECLSGLEKIKLVDDILLQASTEEELEDKLDKLLQRCRETGIKISAKKVEFGRKVHFAGLVVESKDDQTTIKPDPSKITALLEAKAPQDLTGLRSFLGLLNQIGSWVPDLAQMTANMRTLLKKAVPSHTRFVAYIY